MSGRIDFVVFGITGYTGAYCLRKLININKNEGKNYTFGAAGRNQVKVKSIVYQICQELNYDETKIEIIVADVEDKNSLINLTKQAKVIINAVGPYQLYGRQVVEACIETGTNHVDLSGEPQYLEKIQLDLHEEAKKKGIFIIGACGFDSIPTDCGIDYLKNQCKDIVFNEVEGFIVTKNQKGMKVNIGTYHSLIESIFNHKQIREIRNKLYPKIFKKKFEFKNKLKRKLFPFKTQFSDKLFVPFWQTDKSVLRRSQALFYESDENFKPVQFEQYFEIPNYLFYFVSLLILPIIFLLSQHETTKNILLNYPEIFTLGLFSKTGPTRQQVEASWFSYYLCGKGIKNDSQVQKTLCIEGPEIAYDSTSIFIVSAAVTILEELVNDKSKAGVVSPGFAFHNTNLIERTKKLGIKWDLFNFGKKNPFKSSRTFSKLKEFDYQYIEKSKKPTDAYQSNLKVLLIPKLEDTCSRYLTAIRPLIINQKCFNETEKIVNHFESHGGKTLNNTLNNINKDLKDTTYFNEDWTKSYLFDRKPILINVNPYLILRDDPNQLLKNPVLRATNLIISFLRYRRSLIENCLTPEKIEMRPFKYLFSTTRIPEFESDHLKYSGLNNKHIVILHNGQFFKFDVLDDNNNIKSVDEIHSFVSSVSKFFDDVSTSITPLCSLDRNKWASLRKDLIDVCPENKRNLEIIDSALFIVCLDEEIFSPQIFSEKAAGFMHGSYNVDKISELKYLNRWFDKSIQLIISKNGDAGVNFEHTWGDAAVVLSALEKVYSDSIKNRFVYERKEYANDISNFLLNFELTSDLKIKINEAFEEYKRFCSSTKLSVVTYNMSKDYLKNKKISPDFVFQMAFQLAYYKIFTKTVATYESCSTSGFKMGRTENIRAATMETKKACNAMAWGEKKFTFIDLREILQKASDQHRKLCKLAASGQGCDRHLFALKCLAEKLDMEKPSIFKDPNYTLAQNFVLSTSQLYSNNVVLGGYGPVVKDGFGLSYGFIDEKMSLNCTSFEENDAFQFSQAFLESLTEINNILERSQV